MRTLAILWFTGIALGIIIPALMLFVLPSIRWRAPREKIGVGETSRLEYPPVLYVIDGSLPRSSGGVE